MAESRLTQVQQLVESLSPSEQVYLLSTLALRISGMMTSTSSPVSVAPESAAEAWKEFFRPGDTLAVSDTQESGALMAAVLAMRR
jgi:hypothetical protein